MPCRVAAVLAGIEQVSTLFELLMSYAEEQICVNLSELVGAVIEMPNPSRTTSRSGFLMMAFESHKVELERLMSLDEAKNLNTVLQQFGNLLALLNLLQEAIVSDVCVCVCDSVSVWHLWRALHLCLGAVGRLV